MVAVAAAAWRSWGTVDNSATRVACPVPLLALAKASMYLVGSRWHIHHLFRHSKCSQDMLPGKTTWLAGAEMQTLRLLCLPKSCAQTRAEPVRAAGFLGASSSGTAGASCQKVPTLCSMVLLVRAWHQAHACCV